MYSISLIGAGNMAFRLSLALTQGGYCIDWILNRTPSHGEKLVKALTANGSSARLTSSFADILSSDIIIIAISDDAIYDTALSLKKAFLSSDISSKPIVFHTSGATDIQELAPLSEVGVHFGVLYPMMTLSKGKDINFSEIPFLFETDYEDAQEALINIASSLKGEYLFCDSRKRLRMHCAAVFSCNFVNYILSLAFEVSGDKSTFLLPATFEMVRKAFLINPDDTQTGPAIRGDKKTMEKHIKLLQELNLTEEEEIYKIISKNIPFRKNK